MRIERTGKVEILTPRVERFLVESLSGHSLDELQSPNSLRADFVCLGGLLAVELKSLEDAPTERIDNLVEELRERSDWPIFFGSAPMESFIQNTTDPEGVAKVVLERVSRGLINPLKKANRQLEAHSRSFPRRSQVRLLILVNEDHGEYDPHMVAYVLWHAVRRREAGKLRFGHVDAILYLTERHGTPAGDRLAHPIVSIESPAIEQDVWKGAVVDFVTHKWPRWNDMPTVEGEADISAFETIEHIPETMPRHELWRIQYRREPYMRGMTKEQLHERFEEVMLLTTIMGLKGSPLKLPVEGMATLGEQLAHLEVEMAWRAIPVTEFDHDTDRAVAAGRRLRLPVHVIAFYETIFREADVRNGRGSAK